LEKKLNVIQNESETSYSFIDIRLILW